MDWQHVKDRVTEEVLKQMKAEGMGTAQVAAAVAQAVNAAAAAPVAPAAAGGATAVLPACDVGDDFRTDVLVVAAGPVSADVMSAIRNLAANRKVTVVSSDTGERLAEVQACGQVVGEGTEVTARRLVAGTETIVVPVITTSTAAKVGSLIGDDFAAAVLVQAALAGKKVLVAREGMAAPTGATWSIRHKVEEVVSALRTLGFTVTDLNGAVAAATGRAAAGGAGGYGGATGGRTYGGGTPSTGQGGFVPAYKRQAAAPAAAPAVAPLGAQADAGDYDRSLARMIDHTLLKPEATAGQITKICQEAKQYHFMSVCVNPGWVQLCSQLLAGSNVKVCTVIGFPLGATSTAAKAAETTDAIAKGATEVDMVLNVGAMKSGHLDQVLEDMKAVAHAARGKALVKVILETGLLTNEEKVKACEMAKQAGLDFVKTSTGFGPGGATVEDIALMRKTVGPNMGVKASGGIRDFDTAMAMVRAGANRIGASASVNIVKRVKPDPNASKGKY